MEKILAVNLSSSAFLFNILIVAVHPDFVIVICIRNKDFLFFFHVMPPYHSGKKKSLFASLMIGEIIEIYYVLGTQGDTRTAMCVSLHARKILAKKIFHESLLYAIQKEYFLVL